MTLQGLQSYVALGHPQRSLDFLPHAATQHVVSTFVLEQAQALKTEERGVPEPGGVPSPMTDGKHPSTQVVATWSGPGFPAAAMPQQPARDSMVLGQDSPRVHFPPRHGYQGWVYKQCQLHGV